MKRTLTLTLSELAFDAVGHLGGTSVAGASLNLEAAVRVYLEDEGAERAGWAYPSFLAEAEPGSEAQVTVEVDEGLWQSLESEARKQGVAPGKLAEHAVLYAAAAIEAGRVVPQLLDSAERAEAEEGARAEAEDGEATHPA